MFNNNKKIIVHSCKSGCNLRDFFIVIKCSALKLFILSLREHEADKFERLESLLTRMKQYESFFRAAPEAFIQLTFRIISWSRAKVFEEEGMDF